MVQLCHVSKSVMPVQTVQKNNIMVQNHLILSGNTIRKIMKTFKALSNVLTRNKVYSGRLGHSVLKPILNSVSVRVPTVTFKFSVIRPHRTHFSFETDKIYAMKMACNLEPLCEVSFNLFILDENTRVLK